MFRKWLEQHDNVDFDFSGELFPKAKDRTFWESRYDDEYVANAEKYIDYSWPQAKATDFMAFKVTGNRSLQETPHFDRRLALDSLLAGEIMEYKGRFLPDILNGVFAICEETYWGLSAHFNHYFGVTTADHFIPDSNNKYIDLFAAETGATIATVYYMLYDELKAYCPDILEYMKSELYRRIINPYLETKEFWWMGYTQGVNNWNPWILSNVLTAFLLIEKDNEVLNRAVKKMIYEINCIYTILPDDGGCDEGSNYWTVSGGMIFYFVEQLYRATNGKINFFGDEKLKKIFLFSYNAYIGDGKFINFADGGYNIGKVYELLYMIGMRLNMDNVKAFAKEMYLINPEVFNTKVKVMLYSMIYRKEISCQKDFVPGEDVVLDKLQVASIKKNGWYYAIKGGNNNEGHNHNDVGSFIICNNNRHILCDPGCGVYTRQTFGPERYSIWTMRSDWHNLPVINGVLQKAGSQFCCNSFKNSGKETLVSFADAYSSDAGIKLMERKIALNDDSVDLTDQFELAEGNNVIEEHFITHLSIKVMENAVVIGDEFVLECDNNTEVFCDNMDFAGDEKLEASWQTTKMNRIIFKINCGQSYKINFKLRRLL